MPHNRKRSEKDIGSESPASGEAKEQSIAGHKGGPQGDKLAGSGRQPPQTSNRRSARHEHLPEERKSFEPEEDPSMQGEGSRSAESIKKSSSMQGFAGRGHSTKTHHKEISEEVAESGEPREGHARDGRQHIPGDRQE